VQLDVYSVTGQRVAALADGQENAGLNEHIWDGTFDNSLPAPSGVYLYRLTVRNGDGSYQQVRRMVLGK
jgi:flagellar hook assembly protein FlgD